MCPINFDEFTTCRCDFEYKKKLINNQQNTTEPGFLVLKTYGGELLFNAFAFGYVNPLKLHGIKKEWKKTCTVYCIHTRYVRASTDSAVWIQSSNSAMEKLAKRWNKANYKLFSSFSILSFESNEKLTTLKKEEKKRKTQMNGCRKQVPKTICVVGRFFFCCRTFAVSRPLNSFVIWSAILL